MSTPRARIANDPTLQPTARAVARFWNNVVKGPDDPETGRVSCWLWVGPISTPDGYGRISWQQDNSRRTLSAHRFALLLHSGNELPSGLIGEHACCEPLCVRVHERHLRVATQAENIQYAAFRGRAAGAYSPGVAVTRAERSFAIRAALENGWDDAALAAARDGIVLDKNQLRLW